MNCLRAGLLLVILLAGCAFDRYQADVADNRYRDMQPHADADAAYVGEWTAATTIGIRSIKIREDGRIKVCLSPTSGTEEGKVYLEDGVPVFILETGAKVRIVSASRDALLLDVYGRVEKYHAGLVEAPCVTSFKNFQ